MIRVLFVVSENGVGMRPFAASIINTLYASGKFDISVVCVDGRQGKYSGLINRDIARVVNYPSGFISRAICKIWPHYILRVVEYEITRFCPDYIHFLTGEFTFAFPCLMRVFNHNFYYTVHDLYPHERYKLSFKESLIEHYVQWGNRLLRRKACTLTTSSKMQMHELEKLYPASKVMFTPFPTLVTDKIRSGEKHVDELNGRRDYILFFGSVDLYKGIDILIKAWSDSDYLVKYQLVIAGRGNDIFEEQPGIIRINRFIDDEEIVSLFNNAAVIVYPYRSATMSGVLSLAYYFKKKVVCSDVDFFKQYQSRNTIFFERGNSYKLQNALIQSLSSDYYDDNAYEEYFSKDCLVEAYVDLYVR